MAISHIPVNYVKFWEGNVFVCYFLSVILSSHSIQYACACVLMRVCVYLHAQKGNLYAFCAVTSTQKKIILFLIHTQKLLLRIFDN